MLVEGSNSRIVVPDYHVPPRSVLETHRIETLAQALAEEGLHGCGFLKLDL